MDDVNEPWRADDHGADVPRCANGPRACRAHDVDLARAAVRQPPSAFRRIAGLVGALAALVVAVGGIAEAESGGSSPSVVVPVTPFRILDTRQGIGGTAAPIGPDSAITVQIAGVGTVPADATGVVLNLTATAGTEAGWVTAWPTGSPRPEASVLNITPGQDLPNMITASLGDGGRIDLYNFGGHVHLVADVAAYLVPAGSGTGLPGPAGPMGPAGPAGPASPSHAYAGERAVDPASAESEISSIAAGQLLGTLPLPVGSFAISASVEIGQASSTDDFSVRCRLIAGVDEDTSIMSGPASASAGTQLRTTVVLDVVHTFATAGEAAVRCNDTTTQPARWMTVSITAVQVTGASTVALA